MRALLFGVALVTACGGSTEASETETSANDVPAVVEPEVAVEPQPDVTDVIDAGARDVEDPVAQEDAGGEQPPEPETVPPVADAGAGTEEPEPSSDPGEPDPPVDAGGSDPSVEPEAEPVSEPEPIAEPEPEPECPLDTYPSPPEPGDVFTLFASDCADSVPGSAAGGITPELSSVSPMRAAEFVRFEIPFSADGQSFGWNAETPVPVDLTGAVVRMRYRVSFGGDFGGPESVQLVAFSDSWASALRGEGIAVSEGEWNVQTLDTSSEIEVAPGSGVIFHPSEAMAVGFMIYGPNDGTASTVRLDIDYIRATWR